MKGFTLIELLVVVLIIGILAAVALPQYQVAVSKTRMATYLPLLRTLQKAQEQYYMANGYYTTNIRDLDVNCQQYGTGAHENWCYLNRARILISEGAFVLEDDREPSIRLLFFYGDSPRAACYAYDDYARRVCKSLTGNPATGGWDNVTTHRLF